MARPHLEDLYREHSAAGYRLAHLLMGDPELAADLLQDAFVRIFSKFQDLRDPNSFRSYLRRTLINLSNSYFRRRKLERSHQERGRAEQIFRPPDPDERREVDEWLMRLPQRQRAAVVLRFYEDMSESDAAEVLQISVPALKSLVQRALKSLRKEVSG
jgi:RNA polymerase sigma-70 factor (sigma-E family)